jgi:hypothetical protein
LFKRIVGVILLVGGLLSTVLSAVTLAFAIPSNFTVSGKGLEKLVNLVVKYDLRNHVLFISLGLVFILSALVLLLSPRRIKVRTAVPTAEDTVSDTAAESSSEEIGEPAPEAMPRLVQVYHTNLMGTGLANPGGRSRQMILRETRAGDVVACRTVVKRGEDETETVGVFTVKGEQMGFIDLSILRAIRDSYPNHRIGVTIERIRGGRGVPYTCGVRVGVYRS